MKANTMDRDTILNEIISEVVQGLIEPVRGGLKKDLKLLFESQRKTNTT